MVAGIVPSGEEYADTAAELVKLRREAKLNGNFFVEPEEGLRGWGVGIQFFLWCLVVGRDRKDSTPHVCWENWDDLSNMGDIKPKRGA